MDERAALALVGDRLPAAGDDCAVVDDLVVTTDMLHERADFPAGTTRYTAGWRAVGIPLSETAITRAQAQEIVAVRVLLISDANAQPSPPLPVAFGIDYITFTAGAPLDL